MKNLLTLAKLFLLTALTLTSTSVFAWYDPTGYWGKCYPNRYDVPSRGKYTFRGELMLLRPTIDNLSVSNQPILDQFPAGSTLTFTNCGQKRKYKWNDGFKIGVGYACNDCWEADLNWTSYRSKAYLWDFNGARTKWKLDLELVDLEIGKELWFGRCIRFKPHAGLRVARIYQTYWFKVPGVIFIPPAFAAVLNYKGKLRHNYLAGGPRIGFDAHWCVGCGFNLFMTGAASWVWGEMQNTLKDNLIVCEYDKDHPAESVGMTDFSAGIGWSDLWYNERRRLTFRVGYEHHFFIQENKFDNQGALVSRNKKTWYIQGVGGSIILDF